MLELSGCRLPCCISCRKTWGELYLLSVHREIGDSARLPDLKSCTRELRRGTGQARERSSFSRALVCPVAAQTDTLSSPSIIVSIISSMIRLQVQQCMTYVSAGERRRATIVPDVTRRRVCRDALGEGAIQYATACLIQAAEMHDDRLFLEQTRKILPRSSVSLGITMREMASCFLTGWLRLYYVGEIHHNHMEEQKAQVVQKTM